VYFFAWSIVIGGSLDQLVGSPDGAEAEVESEGGADGESEVETGGEAVLPEDAGDPGDPAAEPIVPLEAHPDSSSNPLIAAAVPMPVL
jgi:hypothetical protein